MVEKKFVIENKHLTYDGPFDLKELYDTIEQWIISKHKEKEIKMKRDHVEKTHKNIEYFLEIWEDMEDLYRNIVRIRILIKDMKDVNVKIGKSSKKMNKGHILVTFDGILESDLEGKWEGKPIYFVGRWIFERYFFKFHQKRWESHVAKDTNDLYNTMRIFFQSYNTQAKV